MFTYVNMQYVMLTLYKWINGIHVTLESIILCPLILKKV